MSHKTQNTWYEVTEHTGPAIRALIKKHGITQEMLAEWSGIAIVTLRDMLSKKPQSRSRCLGAIAEVLRVSVKELQEGED